MLKNSNYPYYRDVLKSAVNECRKKNPYLNSDNVKYYGAEIIGIYVKNLNSLPQLNKLTYDDSVRTNFVYNSMDEVFSLKAPKNTNIFGDKEIVSNKAKTFDTLELKRRIYGEKRFAEMQKQMKEQNNVKAKASVDINVDSSNDSSDDNNTNIINDSIDKDLHIEEDVPTEKIKSVDTEIKMPKEQKTKRQDKDVRLEDAVQNTYLNKSDALKPEKENVTWTDKDIQNMKYVISMIGYDPYDDMDLSASDLKYCYNVLASYCDTDGVVEDGHKLRSVIEISMLYCQARKITEAINDQLKKQYINSGDVSRLTSSKSTLLSSISQIAKDNNISSNYNKNSKQGQTSLTSKIKEMEENGFEEIQVNMFDIKTAEAFKQIDEISNTNIANQLTLDNNEYNEIVKEQREMIIKYENKLDELNEENRKLKNQIIQYETARR